MPDAEYFLMPEQETLPFNLFPRLFDIISDGKSSNFMGIKSQNHIVIVNHNLWEEKISQSKKIITIPGYIITTETDKEEFVLILKETLALKLDKNVQDKILQEAEKNNFIRARELLDDLGNSVKDEL